ncbi:MAG: type I restriction-modification system subunit M, partial [Bacteroidia bacterium]|nr:type I restriction-modification system subunit M [Bacteroidia bacterium]
MQEEYKRKIEQQLCTVVELVRAKVPTIDRHNYILGLIFFKTLSDRVEWYANKWLEKKDITYASIKENSPKGEKYLEALKEETLGSLGYFLPPSALFSKIATKGNATDSQDTFILDDLCAAFYGIEQSALGTASEEAFKHLFEDLDFSSSRLGNTPQQRNAIISAVMAQLNSIDFQIDSNGYHDMGDVFEYLIGFIAKGERQESSGFYTPIEVSKVLAKIVTTGKESLSNIYDPTCGSGSLLLHVAKEVRGVFGFYGQEVNRVNCNLTRMNMILHNVYSDRFDIRQGNSLEDPQHMHLRFEAIVANPLFKVEWSGNPLLMLDKRFRPWGRLAPKNKADYAIVQHMLYHLAQNGTMAVVLPHGALFRGADEGRIRQYLIKECNYLDAVIGLPANILHGSRV